MNENLSSWADPLIGAVQQILAERPPWPEATYRVQFQPEQFRFRDAAELAPYLKDLGISHLYASPYLKVAPGAEHGYALVDYGSLNPALGTKDDFHAMVAALREHGLGQILDFVPNHMNISSAENRWWQDVLENGPSSPHAKYFDIDWNPIKAELRGKVLLPVLGGQYGRVLEAGELKLQYREGAFFVQYYETLLPLDPRSYAMILNHRLEELKASLSEDSDDLLELESILTALDYLPARWETDPERSAERQREKEVVKGRLHRLQESSPAVAAFLDENLRQFNGTPDDPHSFDLLDQLLDAQVYRLSHWKAASDEINYRRFFDINELAAVSMEDPEVFHEAHRFIFELIVRGEVDGLRIDHIDGLYDPWEYLWRLQWGYVRALGRAVYGQMGEAHQQVAHQPEPALAAATSAIAERWGKSTGISGETPPVGEPPSWQQVEPLLLRAVAEQIDGVLPNRVFPDIPPSLVEKELTAASGEAFVSEPASPPVLGVRWPLFVTVEKILGPEEPLPDSWPVAGTTGYNFLSWLNGLYVDPAGLPEIVKFYRRFVHRRMHFPEVVYRAKLLILRVAMSSELQMLALRLNRISEQHRVSRDFTLNSLANALREILACFPIYRTYISPGNVTDRDRRFIQRAVALAKRRNPAMDTALFDFVRDVLLLEQPPELSKAARRDRALFVGRFQQVTSPVMAKGVEDTSFYRYFPLVSLNEVGAEPSRGGATIEEFHEENLVQKQQRPGSLLATTTHDTKRSEDVRARINVLSEIPHWWRRTVNRWARLNRRFHREVDGEPAPDRNDEYLFYQTLVGVWPVDPPDAQTHAALIARLQAYMEKATHEAKLRTSWLNPDAEYDAAVRDFVAAVLEDQPKNRFLAEFRAFHERVVDWGLYAALSQTLLKLTSPGCPDIYQGQELWDFSLVDPDNRRPVDFAQRRWLLSELRATVDEGDEALLAFALHLGQTPRDSRAKLLVTWQSLQFRRNHADLFRQGRYLPLLAEGVRADHVCAFAWQLPSAPQRPEQVAIVVAPRWFAQLSPLAEDASPPTPPPLGEETWKDTRLILSEVAPWPMKNLFTGRTVGVDDGHLPLSTVLADFPVALLANVE